VRASDGAANAPDQPASGRWNRQLAWRALGTVAATGLLFAAYLRLAGTTPVNSDGAGLVWEARDALHGNVLLHGWWATDVSFYTTELPEYVMVTAVAGVRSEVVHICSALTYTLLVVLAAHVARGRARGPEGVVRALLAAGVILVPQPTGPTAVLLGSPDHVGTAVPVLVLLLLLDRARPRWYVPVAAGLLLAWSTVGDPLIEVVGVIPLAATSLIHAARARRSPGGPAAGPRPAGCHLAMAAAAVLAVPAAAAANRLLVSRGGYHVAAAWWGSVPWHVFVKDLPLAWDSVLALFGAGYLEVTGTANVAFALAHLAGVAVVLAGFAYGIWRLARPAWRGADFTADFLVLAIAANLAAYLLKVPIHNIFEAHEIGPVAAFGAALAGRMLGGPLLRLQLSWPAARALLASGLAAYPLMLGWALTTAQAPVRNAGLVAWLGQHHLRSGLAAYWEGSDVTVGSGGGITMLAIEPRGWRGHLVAQRWETDVALADPETRSANFIVTTGAELVTPRAILATFGKPARIYQYGAYLIMVWRHNLLTSLVAPPPARAAAR
jgi:hypothetical protein